MPDKDINKSRRARARQVSDKDESSKPESVPKVVAVKGNRRGKLDPIDGLMVGIKNNKVFKLANNGIPKRDRSINTIIKDENALKKDPFRKLGIFTAIYGKTTVVSDTKETPNQERDTSPPVDMPKGDATPLQSKETIQSLFSAVALSDTAAIGKMLKAARNEARMTQAAVADAMETHDSAIRRIEAGKHKSNMDTLEKYAGALGLEIELTLVPTKR